MQTADPAHNGNADQIDYWNARAAVTWSTLQERIDAVFTPLTAIAMTAAAAAPGERVIDVGCGCGATVLELARRVGAAGSVLGVDVSLPMLERARARIEAEGLHQARVQSGDASAHAFAAGGADLLFSRFGVMFFADPVAAFANLRRGVRPGGRLLFVVWRPVTENSWFSVPLEAARPLLPPQPPADPAAPGPFALANPDRTQQLLQAAGWAGISIQPMDAPMPIAGPGEIERATEFTMQVGALARALVEADDDTRARARAAVAQALAAHDGPDGIVLGASVWLVSATNPAS
jgi:SAM-dependent methyltransferase